MRLLSNPRYAGRVPRRDGEHFAASFPALVDAETWAACEQVRRQGRHAQLVPAVKRASRYTLSGLLRCGACGHTMSGWTKGRHGRERASYIC